MHIEKAEDFRLRVSEGVPYRSRLERGVLGNFNHKFHAECPLVPHMALRQACFLVDGAAHGAHWSVTDHRQPRTDIHPRDEAGIWFAVRFDSLVGLAQSFNRKPGEDWRAHRSSWPDLNQAAFHQLRAHPLVELTNRKHQSRLFVQECGRPWQFERGIAHPEQWTGGA